MLDNRLMILGHRTKQDDEGTISHNVPAQKIVQSECERAKDAECWINLSLAKTKKQLLSYDTRYAEFKAFKTGNIYNNTKTTNKKGYSTYWETGIIYPDRILNDLLLIFHPELKDKIKNELYYYEQLK